MASSEVRLRDTHRTNPVRTKGQPTLTMKGPGEQVIAHCDCETILFILGWGIRHGIL